MTTIAFDGEIIASDSRSSIGNTLGQGNRKKIFRKGNEFIAGAGYYDEVIKISEYLLHGGEEPKLSDPDFTIMHIKNNKVFYYCNSVNPTPQTPPFAIGSGDDFALAAMMCGKTAVEAVKIAIKCDVYTGGKVRSYRVSTATKLS